MSLKDKSKKELADMAKDLNLKTNAKMDKKALITLIEEHNFKKEQEQKELTKTILEPKEERITVQDLKDIEDARTDMTDEPADEIVHPLEINKQEETNTSTESVKTVSNDDKSSKSNKYDDFSYSEGYREKSSYNVL